jgi:outer membrane protein assembly factor BamB
MANGVVADGKLFLILQRINRDEGWVPTNTPYVAVFDTATDTEIDTGADPELRGIPLPIKNPQGIQYVSQNNMIYIQGAGKFEDTWSGIPAEYSGGIISLDPTTYETAMIVDDGGSYGNISGAVVVTPETGYFIGYAGWGDNTVYAFNPTTGDVLGYIDPYLSGKNIAGLEAGGYADKNGMVWFCNQSDAEVVLVDSADHSIEAFISTGLNPTKVVFCEP